MKRNQLIVRIIFLVVALGVSQLIMNGEDGNLAVRIVIVVIVYAALVFINWAFSYFRK